MNKSPWFAHARGSKRAMRLYCFAYAGGHGGTFLSWHAALGPEIEVFGVELPGRGTRSREAAPSSLQSVAKQIAAAIALEGPHCFAIFGHSLGALLGFEVARYCAIAGLALPSRLFVSGCSAPRHQYQSKKLSRLADMELLQETVKFDGTPPEVLANAELIRWVLPLLRVDYQLAESYEYRPGQLLTIPITVLAGTRDINVNTNELEPWKLETRGPTGVRWFDGGHFFINTHREAVLACIRAQLLDTLTVIPSRTSQKIAVSHVQG